MDEALSWERCERVAPKADTWLPLGKLRWPLQQFNYNFAVGLQVTKEKVVSSGDPAQRRNRSVA